jgi:hypothetical protein
MLKTLVQLFTWLKSIQDLNKYAPAIVIRKWKKKEEQCNLCKSMPDLRYHFRIKTLKLADDIC